MTTATIAGNTKNVKIEFELYIQEHSPKHDVFANAIKELLNRLTHIVNNVSYIYSNGSIINNASVVEHVLIARFSIIYSINLENIIFSSIKQNIRYIIHKHDLPLKCVKFEHTTNFECSEFIV